MDTDVLIMGAGPAGSAAGQFLARAGLRVTILEKQRHPRHHIGESLLPGSMPILHALDISAAELGRRYQPKFGARFYDPESDRLETFAFEQIPGMPAPSVQVFREEFDALLAEKARAAGCTILQNASIMHFDESAEYPSVTYRDSGGEQTLRARFLVDASGREALIATKRREKRMIDDYGRVAIYNYFADLPPHDRHDPDYITMYLLPESSGWVWLIPLRDGRTSVGIVYREPPEQCRRGGRGNGGPAADISRQEALFWQTAATMPRLEKRLRAARITDVYRAIGDYSFTVAHKVDPGIEGNPPHWAAVGDSAGFLDPIFSSGVHLAISAAQSAAGGICQLLSGGGDGGLRDYEAHASAGFQVFRAFVHRVYNRELIRGLFFMESKPPAMHAAIARILAGQVWDKTNPVLALLGINGSARGEAPL